jgi:hypothetical protein
VISFRYHLVTIVALFLALALCVLAGTTVIRSGLVHQLRKNTAQAERQLDQVQAQLDELNGYQSAALPWLTAHTAVDGKRALVVTADGADPAGARNAVEVLSAAGAETVSLTITSLIDAPTPQTRNALADVLGESRDTPGATLTSDAATRLAQRLGAGPSPEPTQTGGASSNDLLVALLNAGFIRSQDVTPNDASGVGGQDELVVVAAGGQGDPTVPIDTVMQRLVDQMVSQGETVAAVQTSGTQMHPFVTSIRQDTHLSTDHLMTVDDVETPEGKAALVLGLSRMLDGGPGGDYGTGDDAQRILPELP